MPFLTWYCGCAVSIGAGDGSTVGCAKRVRLRPHARCGRWTRRCTELTSTTCGPRPSSDRRAYSSSTSTRTTGFTSRRPRPLAPSVGWAATFSSHSSSAARAARYPRCREDDRADGYGGEEGRSPDFARPSKKSRWKSFTSATFKVPGSVRQIPDAGELRGRGVIARNAMCSAPRRRFERFLYESFFSMIVVF